MPTEPRIRGRATSLWLPAAGLLLLAACESIPSRENEGLQAPPAVTIQDLGLADGTQSQAYSINADGLAVGYATDAGGAQRAVYFSGGSAVRLPEPDSTTRSNAYGVNDAGIIVGSVRINDVEKAARWDTPTSQPVLLDLDGNTAGRARSINSDGVIAGFVTGDELPVLWDAAGVITIVDPSLTDSHEPGQLNDEGLFIGNAEAIEAGFIWSEDDGFTFLGGLREPEDEDDPGESDARGLNNNGVVVGSSVNEDGETRAFRWTEARGMVQLGDIPTGAEGTIANAVNDAGLVAGNGFTLAPDSSVATSQPIATLATAEHGAFVVLPTLGGARAEPTSGASINACGVIVGFAFPTGSTDRHAVAWIPAGCTVQ
jgi:probable HAF family extracellular repeat protein